MAAARTVSIRLIARLVTAAGALGARPPELLLGIGLSPELMVDQDRRVPHSVLHLLWREAVRLTGDECFGLHAAELSRQSPNNVLAYAFQHSLTLRDAYRRGARYVAIAHSATELQIIEEADRARLRLRMHDPLGTVRHGPEFTLALLCIAGRQCVARFELREARFRHARPESCAEHERIFAAPLAFEQEDDELVFDRALLAEPMRDADPGLCGYLDHHLEEMLTSTLGSSAFMDRVRRAVADELRGGSPDLEVTAGQLHMSTRSLQRRLQEHELSFQQVVNDVRRDLAARYLADSRLSVAEVAFLVGFAEVNNFHRAFKRWTGLTPAECRRRGPSPRIS
jgi:AraC-like DNA-binding protein